VQGWKDPKRPTRHETRTDPRTNNKVQDRRRAGTVKEFKYLGRITSDDDDDLPAVRDNLKKVRARWARVSRVLTREGATAKMMGKFYLAVVQSVAYCTEPKRGFFQEDGRNARRLPQSMRRQMTRQFIHPDPENEGEWITPPVAATLAAAGFTATDDLC
jgi:hypothetical protein